MNRFFLRMMMLATAALFLATANAQAQTPQAVIREFTGTLELRAPGAANWTPATVGQTISADTGISTGFRSTAVIALGESVITVQPLTRLTLTELSSQQNTDRVELQLAAGRVRADVRSAEGARTDFTVRSTSATASVRGTQFEFDTLNLVVSEGTVQFSGVSGDAPVLIDQGGTSFADESTGRASSQADAFLTELRPAPPIASEQLAAPNHPMPHPTGVSLVIGF
jgi:hypothetical protein